MGTLSVPCCIPHHHVAIKSHKRERKRGCQKGKEKKESWGYCFGSQIRQKDERKPFVDFFKEKEGTKGWEGRKEKRKEGYNRGRAESNQKNGRKEKGKPCGALEEVLVFVVFILFFNSSFGRHLYFLWRWFMFVILCGNIISNEVWFISFSSQ